MNIQARRSISILLQSLAILLGLSMFVTRGHADDDANAMADDRADVAVLKSRADAIDRHLQNTDSSVDRLWDKVNALSSDLSEMHGEERVAWGVITLLCGGSLVVQFKGKKNG